MAAYHNPNEERHTAEKNSFENGSRAEFGLVDRDQNVTGGLADSGAGAGGGGGGAEIVEVEAGGLDLALPKLSKLRKPGYKFLFAVNNMTGSTLKRTASTGGESWPLTTINKGKCVAAWFNQDYFNSVNIEYTADDAEPGIRNVVLYASWPPVFGSRKIGVYAGREGIIHSWYKIQWEKVHDHILHGNTARIRNAGDFYIYEYNLKELDYVQFGVPAINDDAFQHPVDCFAKYRKERLPGFVFVVNNLTGYDLTFITEDRTSWPLRDIKKGECAVGGIEAPYMSCAAHYTACEARQKSISLAASWPVLGRRKIYFLRGRNAADTWKRMYEVTHEEHETGNKASIIVNDEGVRIYRYNIKTL